MSDASFWQTVLIRNTSDALVRQNIEQLRRERLRHSLDEGNRRHEQDSIALARLFEVAKTDERGIQEFRDVKLQSQYKGTLHRYEEPCFFFFREVDHGWTRICGNMLWSVNLESIKANPAKPVDLYAIQTYEKLHLVLVTDNPDYTLLKRGSIYEAKVDSDGPGATVCVCVFVGSLEFLARLKWSNKGWFSSKPKRGKKVRVRLNNFIFDPLRAYPELDIELA